MAEKDQTLLQPPSGEQPPYYSEDDDEISLKGLILTLWGYRRAIVLLSLAATILIIAVAGFTFLGQAKESVAKLPFKMDFEGIDKNQYPNGMKFSTSDILSMPVLNKVYEEDKLDQYLEFHDFKASLAVVQTNDQLKLLEYEYATRLSDKTLNVDQRTRLEAEFLEKKKNVLIPVYTLMWDDPMAFMPADQVAKVLNDILRTWADYADRVKGANQYQISLVSRNILSKEDIEKTEYYIAMDLLRLAIKQTLQDIRKLQAIPGARVLKIGGNKISLGDLAYRLKTIDRFELSPLVGIIRQTGITKDRDLTLGYLDNTIFNLKLQSDEAAAKVKVYENSMSRYVEQAAGIVPRSDSETPLASSLRPGALGNVPTVIPQFSASFLDSLIEMAQENSDAMFRQGMTDKIVEIGLNKVDVEFELEYYNELYNKIQEVRQGDPKNKFAMALLKTMNRTLIGIFDKLMQTIGEINNMYLELSKMNLNPDSLLYNVTEPVAISIERQLKPKKLLMYVVLSWILAEGMIIFGVLIANAFAKPRKVTPQES